MNNYIGCKIIKAKPMTNKEFHYFKHKAHFSDNEKVIEGYLVEYPDNYISWSPKATFENAYREITNSELNLINKDEGNA